MVYYSWDDVIEVAHRISYQGIMDEIEYEGLRDLCHEATYSQREYLYNRLKTAGYSPSTLEFLFSDTTPGDYDIINTGNDYRIRVCRFDGECITDSTVCGEYQTDECDGVNN
jgi:hypothetical protein